MKAHLRFLILILAIGCYDSKSQTIKLTPQVLSTQGQTFKNNDFEISYTVGELSAITTLSNQTNDLTLTQGFQQPDKYSIVIGITNPNNPLSAMLFPNPAGDMINIQIQSEWNEKLMLQMMDISGRDIYLTSNFPLSPGTKQIEVPLSGLSAGTYLCRIFSVDNRVNTTLRFTKVNQ